MKITELKNSLLLKPNCCASQNNDSFFNCSASGFMCNPVNPKDVLIRDFDSKSTKGNRTYTIRFENPTALGQLVRFPTKSPR